MPVHGVGGPAVGPPVLARDPGLTGPRLGHAVEGPSGGGPRESRVSTWGPPGLRTVCTSQDVRPGERHLLFGSRPQIAVSYGAGPVACQEGLPSRLSEVEWGLGCTNSPGSTALPPPPKALRRLVVRLREPLRSGCVGRVLSSLPRGGFGGPGERSSCALAYLARGGEERNIAVPGTPEGGGGLGVGPIVASSSASKDMSLLSRHCLVAGSRVLQVLQACGWSTMMTASKAWRSPRHTRHSV